MNNKNQDTCNNTCPSANDYDTIQAVEQVYPEDTIDSVEFVKNLSILSNDMPFDPQQSAANDDYAYADVYSLNSARMAKHDRALERRSKKCQLTDRRCSVRLDAEGEIQEDRRADNRVANIESIRQCKPSSTTQKKGHD